MIYYDFKIDKVKNFFKSARVDEMRAEYVFVIKQEALKLVEKMKSNNITFIFRTFMTLTKCKQNFIDKNWYFSPVKVEMHLKGEGYNIEQITFMIQLSNF